MAVAFRIQIFSLRARNRFENYFKQFVSTTSLVHESVVLNRQVVSSYRLLTGGEVLGIVDHTTFRSVLSQLAFPLATLKSGCESLDIPLSICFPYRVQDIGLDSFFVLFLLFGRCAIVSKQCCLFVLSLQYQQSSCTVF